MRKISAGVVLAGGLTLILAGVPPAGAQEGASLAASSAKLEAELGAKLGLGDEARSRLVAGMGQVARLWRNDSTTADGDAAAFEDFVRSHFAADQAALDAIFERFQFALEQLDGNMLEINRDFRRQTDLDIGPVLPFDELLGAYDPSAHVNADFFDNKLSFIALLNFPLTTLDERLAQGEGWTRRQWAEARLAQRFSKRIPAEVSLETSKASAEADRYISEYNIWMHHLLSADGSRLFPPKLRLISHWNLRDELKAGYSDPKGLSKQRQIKDVMERIVTQTIPAVVVNNPHVDWNPVTNKVTAATARDSDEAPPAGLVISNAPEPDTRYAQLLNTFRAARLTDPHSPTAPTLIDRRFQENRELPEKRVSAMFEEVLGSPLVAKVAKLIEKRLKRPLEPFDIWYNGFRPRGQYTEAQLDEIVAKRYPTADAFAADIPKILQQLGFAKESAEYLGANIVVDPSRGAGHAMGAMRRGDKAHLRTRVEKNGMNYKGFNIAVHELGHNVEQTFSLNAMDYWLLQGVPNTAFTEALAFVFQAHDFELLGLAKPDTEAQALKTLNDFWATYEISGVGLVDMRVWHWMYDHPNCTPAELREATVGISKDVWNRYYAPVFKQRDVVLLGIYSHMIDLMLYLPDYSIGHMIAFQIEEQVEKSGNLGTEFERMSRLGNVAPDIWMKRATGAPVGPGALLQATERALQRTTQKVAEKK